MTASRLDVGFVPVECPGVGGTGATQTSTLLIEHLSRRHDLTVYVASQHAAPETLPAADRVDYVLHDDLPMLPHPERAKRRALARELDAMAGHDLVHAYSSAFIAELASLSTPTLVTLNSYLPVCPKADFRYRGREHCTGPGPAKCATCIPATALRRRSGLVSELKSAYLSAGRAPLVRDALANRDGIDAYQALSAHVREDYIGLGFDGDRIDVIPHFYDERFDRPDPDDDGPGDVPHLLYVGALQEIKGVEVLVRALPAIRERHGGVCLTVAGSGPLGDRLRSLAAELGVEDCIDWLGHVPYADLPEVYAGADLFVYPGVIEEPFGRVMLEALATRTPVATADVGSMDGIVGAAGEAFTPGDPQALAAAVATVLEGYDTYHDAIEAVLERYAPETVVADFDALYRATANGVYAAPTTSD